MFKKIYIIFGFFIPFISLIASYPWPFDPNSVQHPVTGTLGEYRTGHLHAGVDIGKGVGTNVYPVVDGTVKEIRGENTENECVVVAGNDGVRYEYIHINASVKKNDTVKGGETVLGTIKKLEKASPHLHFEVSDGMSNPLNGSGLTPYDDDAYPWVWGGDDFNFYRQATSEKLSSPLWGKVDILVRAKDVQNSPGSENVGVYRIGYQVNDMEGNTVLPYIENIKFDNALGQVECIYDATQSDNSIYYYWVTNASGNDNYQRWWNTKLKKGENWNGNDALINKDAICPDGKYKVWVLAYDIIGNGGDTEEEKGAADKETDVDNYVPFVDEVAVKKGEEVRYNGKWTLSGSEMNFDIPTDDSISIGDEIHISIGFSEVMASTISVKLEKDKKEVGVGGNWQEGNSLWEGNVTIPDDEDAEGEWTILISSKDLAEHSLDIDPGSIGARDESGDWVGYDVGDYRDKNHKIHVGELPPPRVLYTDPSDNATDAPIDQSPITITFSKPMDETVAEEAIESVEPSFEYDVSWKDEKTLELQITDTLEYCKDYTEMTPLTAIGLRLTAQIPEIFTTELTEKKERTENTKIGGFVFRVV